MTVTQVLATAKKVGISFYLDGGKLAFKAPKGAFTAEFKSQVVALKAELLEFLKHAETTNSGPKVLNERKALLSLQQQNQFTIYSRNPSSSAYHISLPLQLSHQVSLAQLEESLARLFANHEAFFTYFEITEQGIEQTIKTPARWPIFNAEGVENIEQWAQRSFRQAFDLENQLAYRAHITQDLQGNHQLLLVVHHIIFDGWSVGLLAKDFEQCLMSVLAGKEAEPLEKNRLTYLDYSAWQFSNEGAERLKQGMEFWQTHLADAPQHHELPVISNSLDVQGGRKNWYLRQSITSQVEAFAKRFAVTPFVVYHSLFALVVGRFSNQQDVVIGTPVANRVWPQVENIVGNFVNTLATRTCWGAQDTFIQLLENRKTQYQQELSHQSVPFEEVVRALNVVHSEGNPLFQIMFSFQNELAIEKNNDVIMDAPFSLNIQSSKFDLQLDVSVSKKVYQFSWQYNQNKLSEQMIEAMWACFKNALQQLFTELDTSIAQLISMPSSQLEQWQSWNNTDKAFPLGTMTELFTHHSHAPESIALSDDTQRINYLKFYQRSCQWGQLLQGHGVVPEKQVALYLPRSVEMVLALHGVWQAGGAYLPLDISHPVKRIVDILEDAQPQCVITTRELAGNLPEHIEVICLDEQSTLDALAQQEKNSPQVTRSASDLAYVIYTSGSTGMPKGVMVEHKALVNRIDWMQCQYPMTSADIVVQKTPYTFDVSVWELVWPFYVGAELTIAKEQGHKDPQYLTKFMVQQNVSVVHFVPSMLSAMLQHGDLAQVASLKYVFASGEALPSQVVKAFYETVNTGSLHNLYGPTEAAIDVSYWDCSAADDIVPIGRPIQNIQLHVLDEDLKSLPIGAVGELYISGVGLARGYLNRAELTAERFISSPTNAQQKLYKTGDLVYWREDGQLVYIGRSDFQVKLRGLRIELGEIEAQLLGVAGITDAAVVVQEEQLVAYVVGEANIDSVKQQLAAQLPPYMVPEHYMKLEQMPLSANGKLARNALAPISFATSTDVYEAPVGEVEQHIARVWQEILKVEKVSRYDDFFRLGGHSLLALTVLGQLQRKLNTQIPLATIIEFSELKALAAHIERLNRHVVALSKADENQKVPLTKAQQRMWLVQQLSPQSSEFNMFSALTLRGEINVERIETALRKVQNYHGALRTHLVEHAGEVLQQQMPADLSLTVLAGSLDKAHTIDQAHYLVSQPLILLNNSPIKVFLLQQSSTQACLVFVVHHMFSDGLSMALIAESFEHFYHAEHSQLVEAPFHYSDYALTQSHDERTDDQALAWWREYLKDAPEHHGLLLANPRTAKVSAAGHTLTEVIGGSTYQKLSEFTSELGISVFHLMHGLISQVVAQYSSDKDIVIGSPMANRVHPDVENMVGLFLDTFVVRHQIDTASSVSQWLKTTAENCKEAMRHGQVGFEQIVSEINPNRGFHSPIFQIFINHLKQKEMVPGDTKRDFEISQFELPLDQAKYEVSFYIIEGSNKIELVLNYKQELIVQDAAQAYLDALISLIDRVLIDSNQPISNLLYHSDTNSAEDTGASVSLNYQNLYAWFNASVSEFADQQAVTDAHGSVSYKQLDAQVNAIAASLQSRESVAQRVLVYGKRNSTFIGAILACWKIGATAVPMDNDTPIQRAEYIYQDSEADFVLINDATCDFVPFQKQIHLADILSTHSQQASDESRLALQGNTRSNNQVAYLVYTSGSTGKPKGVCGTHTGLINRLQWMHKTYPFASENNVQITQSGFIRTLWETFLPLMSGNHVHILASDYYQDPEFFFNTLNALQVDRIVTTPTVVQSFSQYAKQAGAVLPKLKYWFASGEAMSPEIANEALSTFDDIQFVNLYGSTEVTSDVTHFPLDKNATYQSMHVGQAIANTSVYVVDEQNNKLPALAKGQVAIAGACLAEGYWQRADDSQRAFVQLNGSTERVYLTGDYGIIDQTGLLQLLGRKDDLVNLGGYRCELKEIERAIQRLEYVEDACVIVKDGDTPYLAAYVASSLLSELATQQLTEFLLNAKKELNLWLPYYMLPKSIQVVAKFPVTANGKLDKKALLALSVSSLDESIEATTEVELLVSKVTGELLNQDKVDLARNFFELGGTSIQAAQLRNSIMSELEINLTLATVFNAVSLQSLAQEIEQQMKSQNLMEHLLADEEDEADEEFII